MRSGPLMQKHPFAFRGGVPGGRHMIRHRDHRFGGFFVKVEAIFFLSGPIPFFFSACDAQLIGFDSRMRLTRHTGPGAFRSNAPGPVR